MKRRPLDLFLVLAALVGSVLTWHTGWERSRLQQRHERLVQLTGDLPIVDPTKLHLRAIETGEPLHFAWRVYLPPNYKQMLKESTGGSSSSSSSGSCEFIARVRLRRDEQGFVNVYSNFSGGSSRMTLGDQHLAELLRGRWEKIRVEQLGSTGLVTMAQDQSAILLRLTLPEDMCAEARQKLSPNLQERHVPVLYEIELGPHSP